MISTGNPQVTPIGVPKIAVEIQVDVAATTAKTAPTTSTVLFFCFLRQFEQCTQKKGGGIVPSI